jgi:general secretion pathway protein G
VNKSKRRASRAGFTLIELMVVVVILGLLAAIVVPNVMGQLGRANTTTAKAQISAFKTALVAYKLQFKKYPTSGEGLEALINNGEEKFLDADTIPKDPWNNDYVYTCPGTHGHDWEIVSYGDDGSPGGTGEATDVESWNLQAN